MTYTVYGFPGSRSIRVTWLLEELGQSYKFVSTRPHSKEVLALNPSGKVPVLTHGESIIIDSAAMCLYLADRHPDAGLTYACASPERAQLDSWLHFAQSELEAPLWNLQKNRYVLPENLRLDITPWVNYEFENVMKAFEMRLGNNQFAMGDNFTVADVFLGQIGNWARFLKLEIGAPLIVDYFKRVWGRPARLRARNFEKQAQNVDS